jgi:hypothetical protein
MVVSEQRVGGRFVPKGTGRRRALNVLNLLFLAVPEAGSPGLAACGVTILRLVLIPLAATAAVFAPLGFLWPHLLDGADGAVFADSLGAVVAFGALAFVQETNRYAFVRTASRPDQALTLYATLLVLVFSAVLLVRGADLYTFAWVLAGEAGATFALRQGLPYLKDRVVLVFGLIVVHGALYVYAPLIGDAFLHTPPV